MIDIPRDYAATHDMVSGAELDPPHRERTDTDRLEWLIAHEARVSWNASTNFAQVSWFIELGAPWEEVTDVLPSPREAIDKAMDENL